MINTHNYTHTQYTLAQNEHKYTQNSNKHIGTHDTYNTAFIFQADVVFWGKVEIGFAKHMLSIYISLSSFEKKTVPLLAPQNV